ncbi:MAG TPA: glycosyltransferase [Methylophilus sp.]
MQKLLILDGIGGVPLGREMAEAFTGHGIETTHRDCAELPKISCYGLRSGLAKLVNRSNQKDTYYHLPRLDADYIKTLLDHEKPSHVLVIGFVYKFIQPKLLAEYCRAVGSKLFLYDTDSCNLYEKRREFIFFLEQELPIYQEIFSFSKVTTHFFKHTKHFNASHFPFGAKPIVHTHTEDKKYDVLFVGSGDLRRIFLLEHINQFVHVFGNRWKRNYPLISNALQQRIEDSALWGVALHTHLQQAKIVLNITRAPFYAAETGVNLRIFEALAAGCFLLTDACEEVEALFEVGVEIETYSNATELKDKVNYYLEHAEKREAIAARGHEKLMALYRWDVRVAQLLPRMQLISLSL